ncbi:MAG TPA: L-histidine N(alpha)-methyltransferase [Longimicrobiales bacterium]|nr:L-histidine N(alpha)-methyltransferase [Longimicrobiales bacterium]
MAVHGRAARARRRIRGRTLSDERQELLDEIRAGLAREQRELPSRLFYDERGSRLFEEITRLPEYYLTRAEQALITDQVPSWIERHRPRSLVELGAGSALKTRPFLTAMHADTGGVTYVPIDVSAEFLANTAERLREEHPRLTVRPVAATFIRALELVGSLPGPVLLTFLGSTIGNFARDAAVDLLRRVGNVMQPDDRFILGVDLRKDAATLEAAYNDARGVTAEFNLNILRVMNDEFGADFDPGAFRHSAVYNRDVHCIEMHLVSTAAQSVSVPGIGTIDLGKGETIRTEISCKYDRQVVQEMFAAAGLDLLEWRQDSDGMFALSLAGRQAA